MYYRLLAIVSWSASRAEMKTPFSTVKLAENLRAVG